ncbi:MAG: adenosylcobinamide-GDP ribazoletransferase [Anaerolineaceae bacterium]|nr:adenosylcobinamide-GDP ribazoletransferase [Anaerolineaceae bacterium]
MKNLFLALSFLTIIPIETRKVHNPDDLGKAAAWFPLIGALMGALLAGVYYGLQLIFPLPVSAVLATIFWVFLSGGLHLDGLADSCDGLLNASSPERRLEIMKDPRLGSFGGIGLVLAIFLRVVLLNSIPIQEIFFALPLAAALGRWMLILAALQPMARPGGLGDAFAKGLKQDTWMPAALTVIFLVVLGGWKGIVGALLAHLLAIAVFSFAKRRLGGMTGDVFGLTVEISELSVLAAFCLTIG